MARIENHSGGRLPGAGAAVQKCVKNAVNAESAPAYYTVAQLADRWSICERQVHRFLASGALTPTRFGRSVRVPAAEVARFETERLCVK